VTLLEDILDVVDQVFVVWFARYRRRFGDTRLRSAWRAAAYRASGYVLTWTVASVLLAACALRSLQGRESPVSKEFASAIMIVGFVLVALVVFRLDRRWEHFFANPPALTDAESPRERSLVTLFRGLGAGCFILAAVAIIIVNERAG
jgi:cytochrome b561